MAIYLVNENVVNTYEVEADSVQDAIDKVQVYNYEPIDIDTVEWSAELASPEVTVEERCKRLEAKLDVLLEKLGKRVAGDEYSV